MLLKRRSALPYGFQLFSAHVILISCFYVQALTHLLQCPPHDCDDSIELAIETVAQARDATLTNHLIEFLLGDIDGTVKVYTVV